MSPSSKTTSFRKKAIFVWRDLIPVYFKSTPNDEEPSFLGTQVIRLLLLACLAVAVPDVSWAGNTAEARLNLKKWGLAYCVSTYSPQTCRDDASKAMGAYLQLGGHGLDAYRHVRGFIDQEIKRIPRIYSLEDDSELVLAPCLDIYESKPYRSIIKAQDRYL